MTQAVVVAETKVEHGSPSQLPEPAFVWRRWFAMAGTVLGDALLGVLIWRTTDPVVLRWLSLALVSYNALLAAFYMGGATLTDIWKLISAVRTSRTETVTETKGGPSA